MTQDAGFGNLLPAPSYSYVNELVPVEIVLSTVGLWQLGMTLKQDQGIIAAGTAMGRITASKLWAPYNDAHSDGTEVCLGFIRQAVDTTGVSYLGNIVLGGKLVYSKLTGIDANGIADLNGRYVSAFDLFAF